MTIHKIPMAASGSVQSLSRPFVDRVQSIYLGRAEFATVWERLLNQLVYEQIVEFDDMVCTRTDRWADSWQNGIELRVRTTGAIIDLWNKCTSPQGLLRTKANASCPPFFPLERIDKVTTALIRLRAEATGQPAVLASPQQAVKVVEYAKHAAVCGQASGWVE